MRQVRLGGAGSCATAAASVEVSPFEGDCRFDGDIRHLFRRVGQDETVRPIHAKVFSPKVDTKAKCLSGASDLLGVGWNPSSVYGLQA